MVTSLQKKKENIALTSDYYEHCDEEKKQVQLHLERIVITELKQSCSAYSMSLFRDQVFDEPRKRVIKNI